MKIERQSEAEFLNVDLAVWSRRPLENLIESLKPRTDVLFAGRERAQYAARFELGSYFPDMNRTIRRFIQLLDRLPRQAGKEWLDASVRDFAVGIRAGVKPTLGCGIFALDAGLLAEIARLQARVVFLIYPPVSVVAKPGIVTPWTSR